MTQSDRLPCRRRWSTSLGAAALILALAACGGEDQQPGVATAGGPAAQPSGSTSATGLVAEYIEAQRQWVKCLRDQGFEVPDPDAKGRVDLRAPGVPKKTDPQWTDAQQKCAKYNIPVPEELEEKSVWTPEQIAHRRVYARCMRENGVPDFPDPNPDGNWPQDNDNSGGPQLSDQQAAAHLRAGLICAPVLDGQPPTTPHPNLSARG